MPRDDQALQFLNWAKLCKAACKISHLLRYVEFCSPSQNPKSLLISHIAECFLSSDVYSQSPYEILFKSTGTNLIE